MKLNRIIFCMRHSYISQYRFYCTAVRKPLKWSYCMGPTDNPLLGATVGQMITRAAEKYGDDECIVSCHQNIRKNFSDFNKEVNDMAAGLLALGLKKGDRVGIWGPNSYEWCLTEFALAKAGMIMVNINPGYRTSELKYCLKKVQAKAVIMSTPFKTSNYYEMMSDVAPEIKDIPPSSEISIKDLPDLKYLISMDKINQNGSYKLVDIFKAGSSEHYNKVEEYETDIQFDDPYNIQFTSGTTGNPKAAVLSHFNVVNNAISLGSRNNFHNQKERVCINVPLFHCFGSVIGLLTNVCFGSTSIFPSPGFDPAAAIHVIKNERATSVYGTPTMFVDILNEYRKSSFEIKHLHTGVMAGAPCPEELCTSLISDLKMKDFVVMFGMTETSPVSFQGFPHDSISVRTSSIGYPQDHIEAKVVDKQGKIVPVGTPGELYVRGYCTFLGYWGDEERTKETIQPDRWLRTGDIIVMEETGYGRIAGRKSDMIIRGGENIYPAEIENFFLSHSDVIEAQVFGIPDKRLGEEVAMWVRSENTNLNRKELRSWAKGKISHFKIPKHIFLKEEFPRTVSGKVQKFKLVESTIQLLNEDKTDKRNLYKL